MSIITLKTTERAMSSRGGRFCWYDLSGDLIAQGIDPQGAMFALHSRQA